MTWHDDGRVLVAGGIGLVALAGALAGRRRRGGRALSPLDRVPSENVEILVNRTIHPFPVTEIQRRAWENEGRLVCPHGSEAFSLIQLLPVFWGHLDVEGAQPKVPHFMDEWDWTEQIGPYWCECWCRERKSFRSQMDEGEPRNHWWLPADIADLEFG